MNHNFNVEFAEEFGVVESILIENLYFWCNKNNANKNNIKDGRVWTHNSIQAFNKLFPYLTPHKITRALKNLEENDLIEIKVLNDNLYDRTKWYAVTEKAISILHYEQFHLQKNANGNDKLGKCTNVKNGKSYKGTDINDSCKPVVNTDTGRIDFFVSNFKSICTSLPQPRSITESRKKSIEARIKEYTNDEILEVFKNVEHSDFLTGRSKNSSWKASFDWLLKPSNFTKVIEGNYKQTSTFDRIQDFGNNEEWDLIDQKMKEAERNARQ